MADIKEWDICISCMRLFHEVPAYQKSDEDDIPVFWWEEEGWLTCCNSNVIEYEDVIQWFIKVRPEVLELDRMDTTEGIRVNSF